MEFTNEQIQAAFKKGDQQLFESLFRTYYGRLCGYANGILKDLDEAEELVQQMFVDVWEKRLQLEIKTSFRSYIYRAVHNRCLNQLEKAKTRKAYVVMMEGEGEILAENASAEMQKKELQQRIKAAINTLPEQCRKIFELSRYEELKYAEIAEHLGIAVKTVENQMGKALRLLRVELKDYLTMISILGIFKQLFY